MRLHIFFLLSFRIPARAIEPNAPLADILAGLVLHRLADKFGGSHDPHLVQALRIENEPVVVAQFMGDGGKSPASPNFTSRDRAFT